VTSEEGSDSGDCPITLQKVSEVSIFAVLDEDEEECCKLEFIGLQRKYVSTAVIGHSMKTRHIIWFHI
jgi:hypothetical protein